MKGYDPTRNETGLEPEALPAIQDERHGRLVGTMTMLFAIAWGGFPTVILLHNLRRGGMDPALWFLAVFALAGIGLFLIGLNQFVWRQQTRVTETEVARRGKSLFRRWQWREPLNAYTGILLTTGSRQRGKHRVITYLVQLHHADPKRVVTLWLAGREDGQRAAWEAWSSRLNLPALEKAADGSLVARDVAHLDKSLRDLAAEGQLAVAFDISRRPPDRVRVVRDGETIEVHYAAPQAGPLAIALFLLFPGVFIYVGFFGDAPPIFGYAGCFFLLILLAIAIFNGITRYCLRLTPGRIEHWAIVPWGEMQRVSLDCREVEAVTLAAKTTNQNSNCVRVITDRQSLAVAEHMKPDELAWFRDCLTWHAARG